MGAGGLVAINLGWTDEKKQEGAAGDLTRRQAASRFSGQADPGDRIETLDRLRKQGTITDAEFETLKARIVEGK